MLNRIKKGDMVICLSGKDADKKGKVLRVIDGGDKIVVEKMNVAKKHTKPSRQFQGGIVEISKAIPSSRLMLVCPRCSKPTRVSVKVLAQGKKVRVCKKCNEMMDKEK